MSRRAAEPPKPQPDHCAACSLQVLRNPATTLAGPQTLEPQQSARRARQIRSSSFRAEAHFRPALLSSFSVSFASSSRSRSSGLVATASALEQAICILSSPSTECASMRPNRFGLSLTRLIITPSRTVCRSRQWLMLLLLAAVGVAVATQSAAVESARAATYLDRLRSLVATILAADGGRSLSGGAILGSPRVGPHQRILASLPPRRLAFSAGRLVRRDASGCLSGVSFIFGPLCTRSP